MHIALLVNSAEYTQKLFQTNHIPKKHVKDAFVELDAMQDIQIMKRSLESEGHVVSFHEGDDRLISWLKKTKPDFCFNTCEGFVGESREAHIPVMLEMLGIPYSGPTPLAAALTQDKPMTKKILAYHGILTPRFQVCTSPYQKLEQDLTYPLFVKPAHEGTGMGIQDESIVRNKGALRKQLKYLLTRYAQPVLAEEYIVGRDITCGIIGNGDDIHIPPIMEIAYAENKKNRTHIYGVVQKLEYESLCIYTCPARLNDTIAQKIRTVTRRVFEITECRDYARVDFRLTKDGKLFTFEINALPGITLHGDLTLMVQNEKWSYDYFILSILHAGMKRYGMKTR